MTGYLCATPYHVLAATTLASGLCKTDENILIIMDHFAADEELVSKIRDTGIFDRVILYKSNKKTKLNNVKRLVNAFFPPRLMRDMAKMDFDRFFCFALNFIDISYLIKKFEKRSHKCEFAFADDGLGSYLNDEIYSPKRISEIILKLCGRFALLDRIEKLYVYKPEYVIVNKQYKTEKIPQTPETAAALHKVVSAVWQLDAPLDFDGKILYFEQPYADDPGDMLTKKEQQIISDAQKELGVSSCIKMHPRSFGDEKWKAFDVIETKMPMEAMLLQNDCKPLVMMTNYSTASFATYLLDNICASGCPTVLLVGCLKNQNLRLGSLIEKFINRVNETLEKKSIYMPSTEQELVQVLLNIKNDSN